MPGVPNLEYVNADGLEACLKRHQGHVLGLVAFGASPGAQLQEMQPAPLWVRIPVLGGQDNCFEVWSSSNPVSACGAGNITAFTDGDVLFGSMRIEQLDGGATLEALSRQAYLEIFAFVERMACRHLLRVWNYLPRINEPENGLERYRCFNLGRHEAFTLSGRDTSEENVPAASVLGCGAGPMVIYFLASKLPGKPISNPRQLAANKYPGQYGPRSPIFARAMLASFGPQQCLIMSGTASIVGHETLHKGDVEQQALETIRNIRMLLQQAYPADSDTTGSGHTEIKAYVRNAQDLERARSHIEHVFGSRQHAIYLQSDICRSDLLVEIEGVHFSDASP